MANEESHIEVNKEEQVIVDKDTIQSRKNTSKKVQLNHVVLPYGKQSKLQLPDGSTVFLNSGTRFFFPAKFSGPKRKVYLQGEAMFQVAEDENKPFIVHTPEMDILVTGTEFNVTAYNDDGFTQAVLVSGSVKVSKPGLISKRVKLTPGQSATINKSDGSIVSEEADAGSAIAWTHGYLVFNAVELSTVIRKLERYYNHKIGTEDERLLKKKFSGKLDITKDLHSALGDICFASGLRIQEKEENNTKYIIKR